MLAQTNSTSESLANNQSTPTSTISAANITTSLPAVQPPAISPTMNRTMNSSINTSNWHNLHNKDPVIHWARSREMSRGDPWKITPEGRDRDNMKSWHRIASHSLLLFDDFAALSFSAQAAYGLIRFRDVDRAEELSTTIVMVHDGIRSANNVLIEDILPNVDLISASPAPSSQSGNILQWNIGELNLGKVNLSRSAFEYGMSEYNL